MLLVCENITHNSLASLCVFFKFNLGFVLKNKSFLRTFCLSRILPRSLKWGLSAVTTPIRKKEDISDYGVTFA